MSTSSLVGYSNGGCLFEKWDWRGVLATGRKRHLHWKVTSVVRRALYTVLEQKGIVGQVPRWYK